MVVVLKVLINRTAKRLFTQENKVIQALSLNRFHEALGITILLRAPHPGLDDFHSSILQNLPERLRVENVVVADKEPSIPKKPSQPIGQVPSNLFHDLTVHLATDMRYLHLTLASDITKNT